MNHKRAALLIVAAIASSAGVARADDFGGTWKVTGPANCPFQALMVVKDSTVHATIGANAGTATIDLPIATDGAFSSQIGAPFSSNLSGKFTTDAVHVTIQSSRCGTVTASGSHG